MGKNKLAKFAELETFTNVFQVKSGVLLGGEGFELKGKWNEQYFQNPNPVVLELGCGKRRIHRRAGQAISDKNYIRSGYKRCPYMVRRKRCLYE